MALISCPECGKTVSNTVQQCPHCGYHLGNVQYQQPQQQYYQQPQQQGYIPHDKPDNNMAFAILCTILCSPLCGIVSIVYAAKVNDLWYAGKYDEARSAASTSRGWAIAGAIISIVFGFIVFLGF